MPQYKKIDKISPSGVYWYSDETIEYYCVACPKTSIPLITSFRIKINCTFV